MAHIVFFTVGVTSGRLNSNYKLAHQLHQREHRITFVSPYEPAGKQVTAQGFAFVCLEEEAATLKAYEVQSQQLPKSRLRRAFYRTASIKLAAILWRYIVESNETDRVIEQLNPNLLLIEAELYDHIIKSAKHNIPTLLLEHQCSSRKAPGVPILYSSMIPNGSVWSQVLAEASWKSTFLRRDLKSYLGRHYYQHKDWMSAIRSAAQRNNFSLEKYVDYRQWHFLTYKHLPTLFLSAPEFDIPHEVAEPEYYVGPMVFLEREEPLTDPHYQAVIQALDAKRAVNQTPRRLVYCAMGSIIANTDYYQRVIDVFAEKPEWDLLVSVGRQTSMDDFRTVPSNVYALQFVPQLDVLKRADLMLNHGGINTINECLLLGVPMIVNSGGVMDENGNAARVAYHGLGVRGDLQQDSTADIARNIERVLTNPQIKTNVQKMQRTYMNYHQSDRAIKIIEGMLT